MPYKKVWGAHGTVRRYRQGGCNDLRGGNPGEGERCDKCKLARREFAQGVRAGQAIPPNSNVTSLLARKGSKKLDTSGLQMKTANSAPKPPQMTRIVGANERAVEAQLGSYREEQPVRYEMALTAARILDDPERVSLHGTILRQLEAITEKLTGGRKSKSKGKLAAVQAMTARAK